MIRVKRDEQPQCGCEQHGAQQEIGRRGFLKRLAGATALTGLASQGLTTRLSFAADGYNGDVLVVLSLKGGMDGLNAVVPTFEPRYLSLRPNTGIREAALIKLDNNFGLHPSLRPLKQFWDEGTLGIVHAVGMSSPTRSHFKAMAEMERAAPGTSIRSGWLDRTLGLRETGTSYRGVQIGASVPSAALMGQSPELAMLSVDTFTLAGIKNADERKRWRRALADMNANAPKPMAAPAKTALSALTEATDMQREGYAPRPTAEYPRTELGRAMKDVARLIKEGNGLQVACVDFGDWDMHAGMGDVDDGWLHDHFSEFARSVAAFAIDLGPIMNRVSLLTLTEFGRRVKENGSGGTDHGHGQAVFLLGGGVEGGQIHGQWPGLGEADLVDGDLAGTTDYRAILAEALEKRCGAGSMSEVFPNLSSDRIGAFKPRN